MRNPELWHRELQYAAVGVTAAALVELGAGAAQGPNRDGAAAGGNGGVRRWGWLLLAGGIAAAYAHLVPRPSWGLRSGAAFAQLPIVASMHEHLDASSSLKLAAWGALTGLALRHLPLPDPARRLRAA